MTSQQGKVDAHNAEIGFARSAQGHVAAVRVDGEMWSVVSARTLDELIADVGAALRHALAAEGVPDE